MPARAGRDLSGPGRGSHLHRSAVRAASPPPNDAVLQDVTVSSCLPGYPGRENEQAHLRLRRGPRSSWARALSPSLVGLGGHSGPELRRSRPSLRTDAVWLTAVHPHSGPVSCADHSSRPLDVKPVEPETARSHHGPGYLDSPSYYLVEMGGSVYNPNCCKVSPTSDLRPSRLCPESLERIAHHQLGPGAAPGSIAWGARWTHPLRLS